jgi:hypothetical protein
MNMNRNTAAERFASLNRRHFLRGLGACLALPAFESVRPFSALAAEANAAGKFATTATGAPLRMAFVYFPNGAIQPNWWPKGEDKDFELARTMEPLAKVKHQLQILGGMDHVNSTPGPDGAGDHARASGTFLTGVRVKKTAGADIHAGISIDQVAANQIGHLTRFPSLELTCDAVRKSGNCDSGYSCAYQYNLAWRSPTQPDRAGPNPRLLFERLFGAGSHGEARQRPRTAPAAAAFDSRLRSRRRAFAATPDGRARQDKLEEYLRQRSRYRNAHREVGALRRVARSERGHAARHSYEV